MTSKETETLKLVLSDFSSSSNMCKSYFERGKEHYKNFRRFKEKEATELGRLRRSTYVDGMVHVYVENSVARMMRTIFAVTPFINFVFSKTGGEKLKIGRQLEKAIEHFIKMPEAEFFLEVVDWFKTCVIYGTGNFSIVPEFSLDSMEFLRPRFEAHDFWDIYPDSLTSRNSKAGFIIKRSIEPLSRLEALQEKKVYKNVGELVSRERVDNEKLKLLKAIGLGGDFVGYDKKKREVEVLQYFVEGHHIVIGGRSVVLKDTRDNDYKPLPYDLPLIDLRFTTVPFEYFGMGIPEEVKDDYERVNTIVRQRLDNVTLTLNKPFIYNPLLVEPDDILFAPDLLIPATDIRIALRQLDVANVTPNAYIEEEGAKQAAMDSSGEQMYARGVPPARRETATGIVRLQMAALERFDMKIKLMEFSGIRQIGAKLMLLLHRFLPKEEYEEIIGEKDAGFYDIPENKLLSLCDIKPVGSSVTRVKEAREQQITNALGILGGITPEVAKTNIEPFTVNTYAAVKMALETFDVQNIDELLIKQEPAVPAEVVVPEGIPAGIVPEADEILGGLSPEEAAVLMEVVGYGER